MKVVNVHTRTISQPKERLGELLETLATKNDRVLATDKWSPMRLDKGLTPGSKGGHGPIGYTVLEYKPGELVHFKFTRPTGFNGFHKFEITEAEKNKTAIRHTIEMDLSGAALLQWTVAIRWLHDAYIEDAFDKVENHFATQKKTSEWSTWVKLLRYIFSKRK
jgi:hypothetical protein